MAVSPVRRASSQTRIAAVNGTQKSAPTPTHNKGLNTNPTSINTMPTITPRPYRRTNLGSRFTENPASARPVLSDQIERRIKDQHREQQLERPHWNATGKA